MTTYSVILPAHNEAANLPQLLTELCQVLDGLPGTGEIVVVDDGSADETGLIARHWTERDQRVRLIELSKNQGQSTALAAGFQYAVGEIFITLDADGQNPPREIPRLVAALAEADMVCGWREKRRDPWWKRWASKFANTLRRSVLRDGIHDSGCCFRAFRRETVERVKLFHGMHRFLPALVRMEGYRVREIRVSHEPRHGGRSHYGISNRLIGPFLDLLAVSWMQRRARPWRAVEISPSAETAPEVIREPSPPLSVGSDTSVL